jgi:hypothetical protein
MENCLELALPDSVAWEGMPLDHLPPGIEIEQVLRHLAHRLRHPFLRVVPGLPTEPVKGRRPTIRPKVAGGAVTR